MRWLALVVLIYAAPALAQSQSPRIAGLEAKRTTEDALWKQLAVEGTPIVEDIRDPKGRLLVTFVYRGRADTKHVAVYGSPAPTFVGYAQLARVGATNTFAWSVLADPSSRFTYFFAPGDNFGVPTGMADFAKRSVLWQPDVYNKRPYLVFGSIVELPKAPAQPWIVPKRDTPTGDLTLYKAKSKALGNERPVLVYTPAGFSKQTKYPLVVMFDGDAAITKLGLPIILDELIAAKKIPPVVVLLVGNAARAKELPWNPVFADFVAHDLVPWVRANFSATADPKLTVIAGISFGGLAAAYAAVRHPNVYGNVLSQSGSYWWSADDAPEPEVHARDIAARPRLPLRWWLEAGHYEVGSPKPHAPHLTANRHMRDVLQAKGYDFTYREYYGGHEYISWRGSIADGLIALLAKPPQSGKPQGPQGRAGGMEIDAGKKTIVHVVQRGAILDGAAIIAKLEKLDPALVGEEEINQAGYAVLELGHAKAARALFEWNVKRFPKSGNAHDSLAEAYYAQGDRVRAVASYKKSLELDPKNENAKKLIELLR